jgi:hypothetical protein
MINPLTKTIMINLDYSLIDNVQIDGIDFNDYTDFCDAYIVSADYDGREMTDDEIELLNDDGDFVLQQVYEYIF